jgi:glycosyltransferase involved in cell wall biosynthesis
MHASIVINTYNNPGHLERSLAAYVHQTHRDFDLVIADDGSKDETRHVVRKFRASSGLKVRHVWHEDIGFRRARIVNKSIMLAKGPYIICTDGDMLPRRDWIATHLAHSRPKRFLGGGDYRLNKEPTDAITVADVLSGDAWNVDWLKARGLEVNKKIIKLTIHGWRAKWLDAVNISPARWSGSNASTYKENLIKVNGFDERFAGWGKEDHELAVRLWNAGFSSRHIRYQAITMHLDHGRPYKNEEKFQRNLAILAESKRTKSVWAPVGIRESGADHTIEE